MRDARFACDRLNRVRRAEPKNRNYHVGVYAARGGTRPPARADEALFLAPIDAQCANLKAAAPHSRRAIAYNSVERSAR
jgi:hypothetical protein